MRLHDVLECPQDENLYLEVIVVGLQQLQERREQRRGGLENELLVLKFGALYDSP
jgi:hypothetical protein